MRHARPDDLVALEPLLEQLRGFDQLVERTPGSFYRKSKGFLHFHIDGDDVWCDVKLTGPGFERVRATTEAERRQLVSEVRRALEAWLHPDPSSLLLLDLWVGSGGFRRGNDSR